VSIIMLVWICLKPRFCVCVYHGHDRAVLRLLAMASDVATILEKDIAIIFEKYLDVLIR
jgi:hypothetical protein